MYIINLLPQLNFKWIAMFFLFYSSIPGSKYVFQRVGHFSVLYLNPCLNLKRHKNLIVTSPSERSHFNFQSRFSFLINFTLTLYIHPPNSTNYTQFWICLTLLLIFPIFTLCCLLTHLSPPGSLYMTTCSPAELKDYFLASVLKATLSATDGTEMGEI